MIEALQKQSKTGIFMILDSISPGNSFIEKAHDSKTEKNTVDINPSRKEVPSKQTQTLPKSDTEILEKREHLIQVWMRTENMTREEAEALIDSIY